MAEVTEPDQITVPVPLPRSDFNANSVVMSFPSPSQQLKDQKIQVLPKGKRLSFKSYIQLRAAWSQPCRIQSNLLLCLRTVRRRQQVYLKEEVVCMSCPYILFSSSCLQLDVPPVCPHMVHERNWGVKSHSWITSIHPLLVVMKRSISTGRSLQWALTLYMIKDTLSSSCPQ